jgi:Ni/Co efflux regulator RcnB
MLLAPLAANAQWLWLDAGGQKVFSDTAPPTGTPEKNILKRPGPVASPSAGADAIKAGNASSAAAPSAKSAPAKETELEVKKKQAEEADKAKQKADEDKAARARADNCQRATKAKKALDSGMRMSSVNDKGEREFMSDAARAQEGQRIQEVIRDSCNR